MKNLIKCISVILMVGLISTAGAGSENGGGISTPLAAWAEKGKDASAPSDTIRWFNATYAILTTHNGGDINFVGGGAPSDGYVAIVKMLMSRDWGITDRESAIEMIDWLTAEGHNKKLLETFQTYNLGQYATYEEVNAALDKEQATSGDWVRKRATYDAVILYGENAIVAWDLSRAMMLLGQYYVAGYYTYEEAMDKSLEIAKRLQTIYTSWDDFTQSYLYGYAYWSKADPRDPESEYHHRSNIYYYLIILADSPYLLDFNMELSKDWN